MPLSRQEEEFISRMTPGQRDARIIEAILDVNGVSDQERAVGGIREQEIDDDFEDLETNACKAVLIYNYSGKEMAIRRKNTTGVLPLPDGSGKRMDVISNSNEIQVKNNEDSDAITVHYELLGESVS